MSAHRSLSRAASAVVAVAALALPAAADAATYCVEKPVCSGLDTTFAGALAEAASTGADDRIEIGAVTLPAASHLYAPAIDAGDLQIVGAGRTATILQNQAASEAPALSVVAGPGTNALRVASLGIRLTTSGEKFAYGIKAGAVVEDVAVSTAAPTGGRFIGAELLAGGILRDSTVALQSTGGDPQQRAAVFASESGVLLDRIVADAPRGVYAQRNVRITRSRIRARGGDAVSACRSRIRIDNSLVRFESGGTGIAGWSNCGGDAESRTEARQVTLRGDGSAGSVGIACVSYSSTYPAHALLRGVIVDGADHDLALNAGVADAKCTVEAGNSRVDLASAHKTGPGTKAVTNLGGNTTVDPGFVNPAIGDFRLKSGSSMIDVGPAGAIDPAVEATVDLLGNPRSVSGTGIGTARRDMGAYEFQPQGFGLAGGDEPDPQPPADPAPPAGEQPGAGDAPAPGGPVAPAAGTPARDLLAPALSGLKLRVAGRTARTLRRAGRGRASLRLVLGEGAKVTVVVQRRAGRRWVKRATVTRVLAAGTRSILLRTALKRASAGTYRLRVGAVDAAGNRSAPRTVAFKVGRR